MRRKEMASLARAAATAARAALRPAPLAGRGLGSSLPSSSPARAARLLRRSAVAGLETLLPLHTAVASARLKSCIAVDSTCWCSLSQGFKKRI
ncbi:protein NONRESPONDING TO OXYLIPINS 2, mitochondrial isoform X3 [Triticum aestivum]|uniref:protein NONRESPONDING TO OXYLIPINS 2, mitochondrial isoform X3 n=1 Tax=Triticum aestivum TaxID=4565 RepID=UPI001D01C456|nr:protein NONRESPONDING TO OXYLIPINS 2, mitochondrial-like isoform X3 [Triticum aestivum]